MLKSEFVYDEDKDTILLSDDKVFYTVEGEGVLTGAPSVFMRLSLCNLTCSRFQSPDSPLGCDSASSWMVKNKFTFKALYDQYFLDTGYIENLKKGAVLKLTGGEPLVQQKQLIKFLAYLVDRAGFIPAIDFETNATIQPDENWVTIFKATFTTSPKLALNGDPEEARYKPEVLQWHTDHLSVFKFVVRSDEDVQEILTKYVNRFNIDNNSVFLMPCCGSRKELLEESPKVAELAKKYTFNFSSRLQLVIWDMSLKV